jgi:hypothetical protein
VQVSVKLVVAVSVPVDWLPLVAFAPLQLSDAVQAVALVDVHVSVADVPVPMVMGLALSVTVGAGITVTVADWAALPPSPVQVSVKSVVAVSVPVDWLPLVAFAPLQPSDAVQAVALVELQVNSDDVPVPMVAGVAVSVTVGTGITVTVADWTALPPSPAQVSVKLVVADNVPVDWVPLVAFDPVQPSDAVHAVALVELQVNVAAVPVPIVVGLALSATVGTGITVTVAV